MISFNLSEIVESININLASLTLDVNVIKSISFNPKNVKIDSRKVTQGDLFIAIKGDHHDAHDYVIDVLNKGANLVIVDNRFYEDNFYKRDLNLCSELSQFKHKIISVPSTIDALGQLAALVRIKSTAKFVALTGSSGKTSVKEMTATILSNMGKVLATQGNFNNDIGVPLTLFNLIGDEEYAVIELGANHQGEIAYTASITQPQSVLINTICQAHLEGFGSLKGVTLAKSEIFTYPKNRAFKHISRSMPLTIEYDEKQQVILNADILVDVWHMQNASLQPIKEEGAELNAFWSNQLEKIKNKIVFSIDKTDSNEYIFRVNNDYRIEELKITSTGSEFTIITPKGTCDISLQVLGKHAVSNALAATILSMSVGASIDAVKKGLNSVRPVKGRLFPHNISRKNDEKFWLIDDTYNANVGSMKAAALLLSDLPGYKVFVVGDMAEMGSYSQMCHEEVGQFVATTGIDAVYSVGIWSHFISSQHSNSAHFESKSALIKKLKEILNQHTMITFIIKGSRSSAMEDIVYALQER